MLQTILDLLNSASTFLAANAGTITLVGGILWTIIAKMVPADKLGPITIFLTTGLDSIAGAFTAIGNLFKALGDAIAHIVKSDGLLGSK